MGNRQMMHEHCVECTRTDTLLHTELETFTRVATNDKVLLFSFPFLSLYSMRSWGFMIGTGLRGAGAVLLLAFQFCSHRMSKGECGSVCISLSMPPNIQGPTQRKIVTRERARTRLGLAQSINAAALCVEMSYHTSTECRQREHTAGKGYLRP